MHKLLSILLLLPISLFAAWDDPDKDNFFCRLNPLWSWSKAQKECERIPDGQTKSPVQQLDEFLELAECWEANGFDPNEPSELLCQRCTGFAIERILAAYEKSLLHRNLLTDQDIELLEKIKVAAHVRNPADPKKGFFEFWLKQKIGGPIKLDEGTAGTFGMIDRVDEALNTGKENIERAAMLPKILLMSSALVGIGYWIFLRYESELESAAHAVGSGARDIVS